MTGSKQLFNVNSSQFERDCLWICSPDLEAELHRKNLLWIFEEEMKPV